MREHKYKAWDKEKKRMIDFEHDGIDYYTLFLYQCDGESHYSISFDNSEDDTVYYPMHRFNLLQYTNFKDKNGKEIYDGDILLSNGHVASVIMEDGIWSYNWDERMHHTGLYINNKNAEVIGNIYKNPELLKKEK